jgi:hypothetical protein
LAQATTINKKSNRRARVSQRGPSGDWASDEQKKIIEAPNSRSIGNIEAGIDKHGTSGQLFEAFE